MTTISSTRPPVSPQLPPAPMHVPIENDGGIESIMLELEEQAHRSRDLRNDARDARREQQAEGIADARRSAKLALAGALVKSVAETAASVGSAVRASGSETDGPSAGAPTEGTKPAACGVKSTGNHVEAGGPGTGVQIGAGVGEIGGTVFDHLAQRATTSSEVAEHAAETYGDVAEDAAQAEQDAQGMIDRARGHLDAILTARRDAEAAILRG